MLLGLLCLGLALLGATQTQASSLLPRRVPAPPLWRIPVKHSFQSDKFQGKWYVIGVASNEIKKERQRPMRMYTTTYDLKEDSSYNATSILLRDSGICDFWIRSFVPASQPGEFTLGNIENPKIQSYLMRVIATNYTDFAMVFFKKVFGNQELFKITLYGRTKELSAQVKDEFTRFSKSTGLTEENIVFTTPIGPSAAPATAGTPSSSHAQAWACGVPGYQAARNLTPIHTQTPSLLV